MIKNHVWDLPYKQKAHAMLAITTNIVKPMKPAFNYLANNHYELSRHIQRMNDAIGNCKVNYERYIKSKLWDERTKAYMDYTDNTCQICGGKIPWGGVLHHMRYKNEWGMNIVGRESINDLIVCHSGCHRNYHLSESLQKFIDSGSWNRYPILPSTSSAEYW